MDSISTGIHLPPATDQGYDFYYHNKQATMKDMDIFELLALLRREDWILDFEQFLVNTAPSRACLKLWKYLNEQGSGFGTPNDKIKLRRAVYGSLQDSQSKKFNKLLRQFRSFLEKFICYQYLTRTAKGKLLLANFLEDQTCFSGMRQLMDELLNIKGVSDRYVLLKTYAFQHYHGDSKTGYLQRADEELDLFYFERKLKNIIDYLCQLHIDEAEIDARLSLQTANIVATVTRESPLISVQLQGISFYLAPSNEAYYEYKKAYFENVKLLSMQQGYLLISLVNALSVLPNKGDEIRKEYQALYRFGIEQDLLVEQGKISSLRFNNIIGTAQSAQDYELIELAIKKIGKFIEGKQERKCSLLLAESYLQFGNKQYDKALTSLKTLEKSKFTSSSMRLRKYVLTFKCIYEKLQYDAFDYLDQKGASFRKLLNTYRKDGVITKYQEDIHLNFMLIICKMANRINPNNTKEILLKQLNAKEGKIIELKWIKEKIANL